MLDPHRSPDPDTPLEALQMAFEMAWAGHTYGTPCPRWEEKLPSADAPCSPAFVFLLLKTDIEFRVKWGLGALLTEPYFEHQRLKAADAQLDSARRADLLRWEYQRRWTQGQRVKAADYIARFPEHAMGLQDLRPRWNCPECRQQGLLLTAETAEFAACSRCSQRYTIAEGEPA